MRYSIQQCFQSVRRVMLGGVYTTTLLYVSTVTLVFVFTQKRCSVYTYKVVVLSAEVNYARGMWACRFFWQALGKHSKFSTMRRRKCNFVWIDVEVMLLLTFLASMKAKVRLYQKCIFYVYPFLGVCRSPDSKVSGLSMRFHRLHVKRKAKTVTKCSFLC